MKTGKMIIVSAPSGAGKTTIVRALLEKFPKLEFSVSACSRAKRKGEVNGKDYYFLSPEEFKMKIENDEFVEWEEVYNGSYYGTLKSELERIWSKGNHVIFDVDVVGGLNIKKQYPEHSLAVFVMPPDMETLKKRLENRGTENPESLKKRLEKAEYEMSFANKFDHVLINDDIDRAKNEAYNIIEKFLLSNKPVK